MRRLILDSTNLETLPEVTDHDWEEISMYNNHIKFIPKSWWPQPQLTILNLSVNQLNELSPDIKYSTKLRILDLGHNRLEKIPEEIGDLQHLDSYLYLHHNQLSELPTAIGQLKHLKYLNVSNNRLIGLPQSIGLLGELLNLKAESNEIKEWPVGMLKLNQLLELSLSYNSIKTVPPLYNLTNLRILNLANNQVQTISSLPPELKMLNLRNNQLDSVPESILHSDQLRFIDLRGNQISECPKELFNLTTLEVLDLRWNKISPSQSFIQRMPHGGFIYF